MTRLYQSLKAIALSVLLVVLLFHCMLRYWPYSWFHFLVTCRNRVKHHTDINECRPIPLALLLFPVVVTSPGSVTDTDSEYRSISKYRYRYRSRSVFQMPIKNRIPKKNTKNGKSVFQFCKYTTPSWSEFTPVRSGGQLSQIESFPRSVYSVILHKIVMTIQYSLS